jgi:hypothetical protein
MEWVSFIAGESHSDAPVCVDPVLRYFGIALNDRMTADVRQGLRPYLARMIGTAGDGLSEWRMFRIVDWAVRDVAAGALRVAGQPDMLSVLAPIVDKRSADAAASAVLAAYAVLAAHVDADAATGTAEAAYAVLAAHVDADAATATAYAADAAHAAAHAAQAAEAATYATANVWRSAFALLDELLPKEFVELSEVVAERASEVCGVVA